MDSRLGAQLARHRGTLRFGGYLQYLGLLCTGLGVVGLVEGVTGSGGSGTALDGVYGLVVGTLALIPTVARWRQQVDVHEHGFVWRRLTGTRTVLGSEIRSLRRINVSSVATGGYQEAEITLTSGKVLSINAVEDVQRLLLQVSACVGQPQEQDLAGRGAP
jgi:hypothetical protein